MQRLRFQINEYFNMQDSQNYAVLDLIYFFFNISEKTSLISSPLSSNSYIATIAGNDAFRVCRYYFYTSHF